MRELDLDYQRRRINRLGLTLLAAGGLAAAGASFAVWQQGQSVAALESRLARIERQAPTIRGGAARSSDPALARGVREAQAARELLDRPWNELFQALEQAQNGDIALLSIEPDADKGVLLITAEARQRQAMLDYLQRLEQTPALRNVFLVEHRVQSKVSERPIRFSLSAAWERPS